MSKSYCRILCKLIKVIWELNYGNKREKKNYEGKHEQNILCSKLSCINFTAYYQLVVNSSYARDELKYTGLM